MVLFLGRGILINQGLYAPSIFLGCIRELSDSLLGENVLTPKLFLKNDSTPWFILKEYLALLAEVSLLAVGPTSFDYLVGGISWAKTSVFYSLN